MSHRTVAPRWARRVAAAALVVATGGTGAALALASPGPVAHAAVGERTVITYNMQGGSSQGESAWSTEVGHTLSPDNNPGGAELVMSLQEAGSADWVPGRHTDTQTLIPVNGGPAFTIRTYSDWEQHRTPYTIYWVPTDPNGNRVNLAILVPSRQRPQGRMLVTSPMGGRPAFGIRLGQTWYFTVHGFTGSGNDMPPLLREIAAAVGSAPWHVFGDFNVDPGVWDNPEHPHFVLPAGAQVQRTETYTHFGPEGDLAELDYGITSGEAPPGSRTIIPPQIPNGTDHVPVAFGMNLRARGEQEPTIEPPLGREHPADPAIPEPIGPIGPVWPKEPWPDLPEEKPELPGDPGLCIPPAKSTLCEEIGHKPNPPQP
ncbi:exonuclease/endonuclease/phosphatase family protein [Couchioplanes azureus]|uniref:hypothetical protein n=1 Tax=Couchioplanes caeruleus TaxID=56438 RepID=UPI0016716ECC|nr:hypothetical protein [Couchioplanes caeruleus]